MSTSLFSGTVILNNAFGRYFIIIINNFANEALMQLINILACAFWPVYPVYTLSLYPALTSLINGIVTIFTIDWVYVVN